MLKVLPIQSKTDQELDCARCGITYRPDALAYRATVNDVFVGMCQFKLTEHGGEIYDIAKLPDVEDFEAMFVMGRAALNFIDLCGVHTAFFDADYDNEVLIKAVGFRKNAADRYEMDLTDFFKEPCKHSHND